MKRTRQFGASTGQVCLDVQPRMVKMTWEQFEVICEALHNYTNVSGKKPNSKKAYRIADELMHEWHKCDKEGVKI